jgi:signal peptidase I
VDLQLDENCLPARVVLVKVGRPSVFLRGDLLAYKTDRAMPYINDQHLMGKRLAGLPGDSYRVDHLNFYLNGRQVGELALCKAKYLPRYCDDRNGVVPPNAILMMAEHPNSFDGRYWGPIPQTQVVGTIVWPKIPGGPA